VSERGVMDLIETQCEFFGLLNLTTKFYEHSTYNEPISVEEIRAKPLTNLLWTGICIQKMHLEHEFTRAFYFLKFKKKRYFKLSKKYEKNMFLKVMMCITSI
jgi:hypothetical protein